MSVAAQLYLVAVCVMWSVRVVESCSGVFVMGVTPPVIWTKCGAVCVIGDGEAVAGQEFSRVWVLKKRRWDGRRPRRTVGRYICHWVLGSRCRRMSPCDQ